MMKNADVITVEQKLYVLLAEFFDRLFTELVPANRIVKIIHNR